MLRYLLLCIALTVPLSAQILRPILYGFNVSGGGGGGTCGSGSVTASTTSNNAGGFSSVATTLAVTTGDIAYIFVSGPLTSATSVTISGSGNTATQIGTTLNVGGFTYASQWYSFITTGGTLTFTANISGASAVAITVVDGGSGCTTLDQSATGNASATTGTFTTTAAKEFIAMGGANYYCSTSWSAGTIGGASASIPAGAFNCVTTGVPNQAVQVLGVTTIQTSITGTLNPPGTANEIVMLGTFK